MCAAYCRALNFCIIVIISFYTCWFVVAFYNENYGINTGIWGRFLQRMIAAFIAEHFNNLRKFFDKK